MNIIEAEAGDGDSFVEVTAVSLSVVGLPEPTQSLLRIGHAQNLHRSAGRDSR